MYSVCVGVVISSTGEGGLSLRIPPLPLPSSPLPPPQHSPTHFSILSSVKHFIFEALDGLPVTITVIVMYTTNTDGKVNL